ncbi:MAG: ClpXP protease specificity-enhancing factor SspB [Sneathiellales bacterium]|nr:ClpXP protease specificity-enhancing factor SspB [Sneathiellales bacterium]
MNGEINYNELVEKALMEVVRESLRRAAKDGLVGQQHFYITFQTTFPGVDIPDHLKERYRDEMTIVMQHQFWNLTVDDQKFSLELSFNHQRETLVIPFDAISAFADPSVQFGLQFDLNASDELDAENAEILEEETNETSKDEPAAEEQKAGEVITLDAFRKK